ncbi:MAG TPA: translation initiation factor IF-3 [Streptosporangiaceae bacterium]
MAGTDPSQDDSDAGGHISTEPRINERIRVPEVRLVGPSGEQVGIVSINDALRLAQEADLDLVEVAPTARPPVCKLMDYGKFKYESALKARESRKNQAQTVIKEIKIRPKIDPHDYGTKKGHVERFLKAGDKVKVTIMFRGREQSRPELGYKLLQRLAGDVEELGFVESQPKQDGRNMIMVIGPHRKKADAKPVRSQASERASARAAAPGAGSSHADFDVIAPISASSISASSVSASSVSASSESASSESASPVSASPVSASSVSASQRPQFGSAPARPAEARPAQSRPAQSRPAQPRPAAAMSNSGGAEHASVRNSGSSGPARDAGAASRPGPSAAGTPRPAAPRPTAPRPGPAGTAAPRPMAPRPGPPPSGGPRPTAPKPTAPKPGLVGGAPRPTAPRPSAKPAEPAPVPSPRTTAGEADDAAGADSGG